MKVLMILNSDFGKSGTIGIRALPTAKKLVDLGGNLTILTRDFKNLKDIKKFNIKKVVPFGNLFMKLVNGLKVYILKNLSSNEINLFVFNYFLLKKLEKIDLLNVDIVHCWDFNPEIFKYIKEKNPNIKIIKDMTMSFQNILKDKIKTEKYWIDISDKVSSIELDSLKYIDYYILPSKATEKSLFLEGVKKSQILFTPYGSNLNFKIDKNKKFDSKFKVVFAGNVNNRKGIMYLVKAWENLNLKNAELNIYGRVYPEISKYSSNFKKNHINLLGFVDLCKELPKNHVLVHPSLLETTPKVITEALMAGVPVITTHYSGPVFKNGVEGFIVDEQNSKQIEEKLLFFYNNRDKLKEFSLNAHNSVKDFTWENYGDFVVKHYKKIINFSK